MTVLELIEEMLFGHSYIKNTKPELMCSKSAIKTEIMTISAPS